MGMWEYFELAFPLDGFATEYHKWKYRKKKGWGIQIYLGRSHMYICSMSSDRVSGIEIYIFTKQFFLPIPTRLEVNIWDLASAEDLKNKNKFISLNFFFF
jgi:hypothetical protein